MKIAIVTLLVGLGAGFLAGYWMAPNRSGALDQAEEPEIDKPEQVRIVHKAPGQSGQPEAGGPMLVVKRVKIPAKREPRRRDD